MPAATLRKSPEYNPGNVSGRTFDEYQQLNELITNLSYLTEVGTVSGKEPKNPATSRARMQTWPSGPMTELIGRGPEARAVDFYNQFSTLSAAPDVYVNNAVKQIQQLELLRTMGNLPDLNLEGGSGSSGKQGAKGTKAKGTSGAGNLSGKLGVLLDLLTYSGEAQAPTIYDPAQRNRDVAASTNPAAAKSISNRAFQTNDAQLVDEVARFIVQQQNAPMQASSNPAVRLSPATTLPQDLLSRGR